MLRVVIVLLILCPTLACSASTLEIEFAFTAPDAATVASYKLYNDGIEVCNTTETLPGNIECDVALSSGVHFFFNDGGVCRYH